MIGYYVVRPLVLAQLAQVAVADAAAEGKTFETYELLMSAALAMEDAMFTEVAQRPRRSEYPSGKYVGGTS